MPSQCLEVDGPKQLFGFCDSMLETKHGIWKICLTMASGNDAVMSGVCLDKIAQTFPEYEFHNSVKENIMKYCRKNNIDEHNIPRFPNSVGGETDIMIGIQYQKYLPVEIPRLPSGLDLYESKFIGEDGTSRIIAGPHPSFTATDTGYGSKYASNAYNSSQVFEVNLGTVINPDIEMLYFKDPSDFCKKFASSDQSYYEWLNKLIKMHEAVEDAGTVCSYRCIDCRGYEMC